MTNDNNDNDNEGIASVIARLRKEESNCASVYIIDAAIDTIERLVNERDARKAHAEVEEAVEYLLATIEEQKAEIKRLRTELASVEMDRDILVQHVQRNSQGGR